MRSPRSGFTPLSSSSFYVHREMVNRTTPTRIPVVSGE
jgi:hypothetical protein